MTDITVSVPIKPIDCSDLLSNGNYVAEKISTWCRASGDHHVKWFIYKVEFIEGKFIDEYEMADFIGDKFSAGTIIGFPQGIKMPPDYHTYVRIEDMQLSMNKVQARKRIAELAEATLSCK
jgi:hypothetical protein